MITPSRRHSAAFTLIELMAVITIIAILAGIVIGGMGYVKEKQRRSQAEVQINLLSRAIEEYKMDMGVYPGSAGNTPTDGDISDELYQALFKDGYDYTDSASPSDNWNKATKIYVPELDPRNSKLGWVKPTTNTTPQTNLKITDPWGNNYLYRTGSNAQNPDFDLWSRGKDGMTDPITKLSDDIRNF
jgi:prepilin-type N-terminal cleavage/methylation domain-containing protein